MPALPAPRGPLSDHVIDLMRRRPVRSTPEPDVADPLVDDDLHLALWCCYELHHHGFDGVSDELEWDTDLLAYRARLEAAFEQALLAEHGTDQLPDDPELALRIISTWAGPPLARTIAEHGTHDQLRELAVHRSAYQLKEADGHTWALPRLRGRGRSAMVEIQFDEYGEGRPGDAHAELFADAMVELGLDPGLGTYVDSLPGSTLATDNLVSLFALHRRWRGALVGHLALFEMTSVQPMSCYLRAARRLGLGALARFYEVHVEADGRHADLAIHTMVAHTVADEPELAADVIFGAAALSRVERRFARHLLHAWDDGSPSLVAPLAPPAPVEVPSAIDDEAEPAPPPVPIAQRSARRSRARSTDGARLRPGPGMDVAPAGKWTA